MLGFLVLVVLAVFPSLVVGGIAAAVARKRTAGGPGAGHRVRTAFWQGFLITFAVVAVAEGVCIAGLSSVSGDPTA